MSNDNQIDFTVRVKKEGLGELASDLDKVEQGAKGMGTASAAAGTGVEKLGQAAGQSGESLDGLRQAVDAKTQSIKAGLQAEQSEITLQQAHLTAARAEQQVRLQVAQAQGDEAAATRAGNALRQIEADQLGLVARAKRAEAAAVQQATEARRSELAAIGPLTQAQANELRAAENHAKALRVEAAAADQASQRARDLTQAHQGNAAATQQLGGRVQGLTQLLGQMAGALGAAFTFREFVTAAAQMEQLRSGLTAITQDSAKAAQDLEFVRVVANRIGADVTEVGKAFLGLAASTRGTAVEGEPTRQVFEAVATAMGKAGKSSAETSNALQALAQMASKGVVQSEELRGQLGEALPGALQAAAKGMGLTTEELMKLVEEGKITAQDIFPALAQGLNELYGSAPQAQTLSQEITNIKNAFTGMADEIGQAGGLSALKVAAEVAQAGIVRLGDVLINTGKVIGAVMGAIATMDFSGLKQSFADIEAESRNRLLKAAQHNDVLRSSLEITGDKAMQAALAQQQLGNATLQAASAGAQSGPTWVKLASDYGKVKEAIAEQISETEKSVIARDAEGKAAVALAQAFGTEAQKRQAAADAAMANAEQQERLAQLKTTELEAMKAELAALQALAAQQGPLDAQRQKQLQELEKQIALRQQDVDKTQAQAQAARLHAELTRAQAEALQDNSARVKELHTAYDAARAKVDEMRAAQAAGKATTEQVTQAEQAAGRAALLYRDALNDQQRAIAAKAQAQQANNSLEQATVRLAIEQQRAAYEVAKARGDESGAMRAQNEIRKLEIQLLGLVAQAKRAEAQAALASIAAKREELQASGTLTDAKRLELDAAEKSAKVKIKEAEIAEVTAKKVKDLASAHTELGRSASGSVGGIEAATGAMRRQADVAQRLRSLSGGDRNGEFSGIGPGGEFKTDEAKALAKQAQELSDQGQSLAAARLLREASTADGKQAVEDARNNHSGNATLTKEYVDAQIAKQWGEKFIGDSDAMELFNAKIKLEAYRTNYGNVVRSQQSLNEQNALLQTVQRLEEKLRARQAEGEQKAPPKQAEPAAPRIPSSGSGMNAGGSTGGGSVSYVSNITLPGGQRKSMRFADPDSQATNDRLLRDLAAARGVAQ
ncbi:MAG: tape measure protein [Burkholderiaceae bacterium]|nr:tape measure protein [Burkholderiaceae bacterium]